MVDRICAEVAARATAWLAPRAGPGVTGHEVIRGDGRVISWLAVTGYNYLGGKLAIRRTSARR